MTVAQLIELLRALPQDLPVYLGDWNELYAPDSPIEETDAPRVLPAYDESNRRGYDHKRPERVTIGGSRTDLDQ